MTFTLSTLFARFAKKRLTGGRPLLTRRRPELEFLESRNLLSVTFSNPATMSGDVTVIAASTPGQVRIQLSAQVGGQTIQFSDNNGQSFTSANLAGITSVTVNGATNDTLTLDLTNGIIGKSGTPLPIAFNPANGPSTLILQGNAPAAAGAITEVYTAGTNGQDGTIALTGAGAGGTSSAISFIRLSRIQDTTQAASLTVTGSSQNSLMEFRDGPTVNGQATNTILGLNTNGTGSRNDGLIGTGALGGQGTAGTVGKGNGFVAIDFANKTTVTVNANGAGELISLNSSTAAPGLQTLNLNGGGGGNNFYFDLPLQGVTTNLTNLPQAQRLDDPNLAFVQDLYLRYVGRAGSLSELSFWRDMFDTAGPDARTVIITGITGSDEALNLFTSNAFQQYLGRNVRNDETAYFRSVLRSGQSEEQVIAGIIGSPEFYSQSQTQISSGTPDQRFVQNLYQVLLFRTPSQGEISFQTNLLQGQSKMQVALTFLNSQEFRDNVVTQDFRQLLDRATTTDDLNYFNSNPGLTLQDIRNSFLTSPEFSANEFGPLF